MVVAEEEFQAKQAKLWLCLSKVYETFWAKVFCSEFAEHSDEKCDGTSEKHQGGSNRHHFFWHDEHDCNETLYSLLLLLPPRACQRQEAKFPAPVILDILILIF